jgi:hypothetical protein
VSSRSLLSIAMVETFFPLLDGLLYFGSYVIYLIEIFCIYLNTYRSYSL